MRRFDMYCPLPYSPFDPHKFNEVVKGRKQGKETALRETKILGEWCKMNNGLIVRFVQEGDPTTTLACRR